MSHVDNESQMQVNRMMARLGNLGISDEATSVARNFIAHYQEKIGRLPVTEKAGQGGLKLDYLHGRKRLVLLFDENGQVHWETYIHDERTDGAVDGERLPSLVNWLIHI